MSQTQRKNFKEIEARTTCAKKKGRKRSPTLLKMQWLAERVRKCERIRKQVQNDSYQVDSIKVAKSLLGKDIG